MNKPSEGHMLFWAWHTARSLMIAIGSQEDDCPPGYAMASRLVGVLEGLIAATPQLEARCVGPRPPGKPCPLFTWAQERGPEGLTPQCATGDCKHGK